jgi:hypothetical protein
MTPEEFTAMRRELVAQTVSTVRAQFLGLENYREADVVAFVQRMLPLLRAGQQTMAQLVALYLASLATAAPVAAEQGIVIPPPPIPLDEVTDIREGVTGEEAYRRPFVTIYTELRTSGNMTEGVRKAAIRLDEMVEMDLQQSHSAAQAAGMARLDPRVRPQYWRRVLQGEESCALCVLASTQRYRREDLNPVHPGCDCLVRPIFPGGPDLTAEDEAELIGLAHRAAAELTGEEPDYSGRSTDYRAIRTNITASHGEHPAPLLVRPLDRFDGPDAIPGDAPHRTSATDRR